MTPADLNQYAIWIINSHRNFKTINLMSESTIKNEAEGIRQSEQYNAEDEGKVIPDLTSEELDQIVKATWNLYNKRRDRAKKAWETRRR